MKIVLIGYGKMGKAVEKIAIKRNHRILLKLNNSPNYNNIKNADMVIEFSNPTSAVDNIKICLKNNISIVCGTTGWLDKFELDCIKIFNDVYI